MHIRVSLPKTKRDPLLTSLNSQFERSQKTILGLEKSLKQYSGLQSRHDELLGAMKSVVKTVKKPKTERGGLSEAMVSRLERAIEKAGVKSRSRTFGSNY